MDDAVCFGLSPQMHRTAQVGLVSQFDEELGPLSIGCMFHYTRGDLTRWSGRGARLRRGFAKRKQDNHDCRETKQNGK